MESVIQIAMQFIATVGFPIACCCFLLWQNQKDEEYNRKQQNELRKTIDNNTKSVQELTAIVKELKDYVRTAFNET